VADRKHDLIARAQKIAADLSGMDMADLGIQTPFLSLGFDSLFLTQLAGAIQREFGVATTFRQLIETTPTFDSLAAHLETALPPAAPTPVEAPANPKPPTGSGAHFRSDATGLAAVFEQQLQLMQEQLRLLTGQEAHKSAPPAAAPQVASERPAPPVLPKGFGPQTGGSATLTEEQAAHIAELTATLTQKTAGSKARTQQDRPHHADPRTAAGFDRRWKELVYPLVVERSEGAYLWDVDGNRYIDLLNGFGPNFFGHRAPFITEALRRQLDDGFEIGPQTPSAGYAARLLCELTGMDRASWVNTGSEAVQAAIRIARTVTGRDRIALFKGSYHGNFDEVLVRGAGRRTVPMAPGIPMASVSNVEVLDYGEPSALERIEQCAAELAIVLVEPIQSRRPELQPKEFLHQLRRLTEEKGIVLLFDEVITGFRTGPGGAQAHFGVQADLATYGKVLGGGMPIGAIAGRGPLMDTFDGGQWQYGDDSKPDAGVTFFAGTFARHPMAIAAATASLEYLKAAGPQLQEGINRRAARLCEAANQLFALYATGHSMVRFGSQMFLRTPDDGPLAPLLFYHLRARGIHLLEGFPCYLTAAHTDEDIEQILDALCGSLAAMAGAGVLGQQPQFALSPGQTEIWVQSQIDVRNSLAFNESDTFLFEGPIDHDRLEQAIEDVLRRHDAFRLRFDDEGSVQSIDGPVPALRLVDLSGEADRAAALAGLIEHEARTPFDLAAGPLVRATLVREAAERVTLVLYAHHIAFDGFSAELFLRDLRARYDGEPLPDPVSVRRLVSETTSRPADVDYWSELIRTTGATPLRLPHDRPLGQPHDLAARTFSCELADGLHQKVVAAAKTVGVSASTFYACGFAVLAGRLAGCQVPIIGMPVAAQVIRDVPAAGFGVAMLPLPYDLRPDRPFAELAIEQRGMLTRGLERIRFDLSSVTRELDLGRGRDGTGLVNAVVNYRPGFGVDAFGEGTVQPRENPRRWLLPDSFLNLTEVSDGLRIDWEANAQDFDAATIELWTGYLQTVLEQLADNPYTQLHTIRMAQEAREAAVVWGADA
jgi:glutamate-1-semialdehyde aminotransferase/acyl carrier protein